MYDLESLKDSCKIHLRKACKFLVCSYMILRNYERFLHLPANPCKLLQVLIYLNCSMILRDLDRFLLEPYKKILQVLDEFLHKVLLV